MMDLLNELKNKNAAIYELLRALFEAEESDISTEIFEMFLLYLSRQCLKRDIQHTRLNDIFHFFLYHDMLIIKRALTKGENNSSLMLARIPDKFVFVPHASLVEGEKHTRAGCLYLKEGLKLNNMPFLNAAKGLDRRSGQFLGTLAGSRTACR